MAAPLTPPPPTDCLRPSVAASARIIGPVTAGTGALVAQGSVVRSHDDGAVALGHDTALLELGVVIGATVGDGCMTGEGTVVPATATTSEGGSATMGTLHEFRGTWPQVHPDAVLADGAEVTGDVVIGPGCTIHGSHIGAGSVVEPGAIVCDHSVVGAGSIVRAGACVKQRLECPPGSVRDGFPARVVDTLPGPPERPGWAFQPSDRLPGCPA